MSGFNNLSGRTEDISVKLRAQNMKNTKDTTKKLEQENRKMEERLKELKMAMNREKEERERQGGGFWQRGQVGTLNSYATEVLHDQSNKQAKSGKKKGVKVLKDEPLDLPTRNSGPGTMKYIAQRSPRLNLGQAGRDSKNKGAKCGQCEERSASLTCVQCSENYCAGCFAAFHLKGALKRHRSVPLHATGPRQCMSPRPTPPASSRSSTVSGGASSGDVFYQQADRYGLGGASGSGDATDPPIGGHSLLEGAYNESDSAASFQQALMAWRQGDSTSDSSAESKTKPHQAVVVSPVKSPVTMVEHSTSTTKVAQVVPEVKFTTHSLSYAQRLMLKQHRRTDVGQLTSPRLGSYGSSVTPSSGLTSITPRSSVGRGGGLASDDDDEDFDEEEERVNFQSLYEAMSTSSQHSVSRVSDSNRTVITDVTDSPKDQRSAIAESSTYTVLEVSGLEAWEMQRQARIAEKQESSTLSKAKRLSKSRETTRVIEKRAAKSREATRILNRSSITEVDDANGAPLNKNHSHLPATKELTQVLSTKTPPAELPTTEEETGGMKKKPPPAAAAPRPKSVKSRPLSSRAMSARSRPSSRAQSRATSRMGVEGLLTKTPSSGLQEIARRTADTSEQYQSPLEGFFLAGVKVEDQVTGSRSRPVTPAAQVEKLKVSNKLYAMSPRSWWPDSSLGDWVPPDGLGLDLSALPPTNSSPMMRYTYSGQLQGQALEWNPVDSYGTPVPPEEAPTPTPADREAPTPTPADHEAPTPTPADREAPPSTPGSSRSGRKRWGTPDPDARPFSAQRANGEDENNSSSDTRNQMLRPNSSTGGAEPSKRQRRQLPAIDRDLDSIQRARVRRQRTSNDGWTGEDDEQKDPIIRQLSASRTRSWVASQNSFRPGSGHWETEVEEFIRESSDLEGGNELTPRAPSQQLPPVSARSSRSRSSPMEVSGRASRAIVMDGEDLSKYDADISTERRRQNTEDREELDKLEWELASESGRLTADGQISRLDIPETEDDGRSSGSRSGSSTVRLSFDQGYDINTKLRDDELSDGENEQRIRSSMDLVDEEEVRALR